MKVHYDLEWFPSTHKHIVVKEGNCLIRECFYQIKGHCNLHQACPLIKKKEHYEYRLPIKTLLEEL
jgi:hypothetical protein